MELKFEKYDEKYLESCAALIRSTWKFEKEFIQPQKPEIIYQYYVLSCVNYSEHLDLIVDEHDEVKGMLFGSIEDADTRSEMKYKLQEIKTDLRMLFNLLRGDFGNRKTALKIRNEHNEVNKLGETTDRPFDSEVNLFIVSPELRGMGYGKKLMDRYIEFCKENDLHSAFLWTDIGCSYNFYEKYGFKLYKQFFHEGLTPNESNKKQENGMIYYLEIE
ncbi:GNAT family N-acetyltransferase [Bacillus cereus]|nr:GNAT family N-acetyltransferase [Bacillus cereus]